MENSPWKHHSFVLKKSPIIRWILSLDGIAGGAGAIIINFQSNFDWFSIDFHVFATAERHRFQQAAVQTVGFLINFHCFATVLWLFCDWFGSIFWWTAALRSLKRRTVTWHGRMIKARTTSTRTWLIDLCFVYTCRWLIDLSVTACRYERFFRFSFGPLLPTTFESDITIMSEVLSEYKAAVGVA